MRKQNATINNKTKYNKNVHKKYGWRGGILVERSEKGVEGHFETAFTLDKDEKYDKVNGNPIPAVLDLVGLRPASLQENPPRRRNSI